MSTLADLWIRCKYLTSLLCISVWEWGNWSQPCKEQSWLRHRGIQSLNSGGNVPPSGKGRRQSTKMEPGGPFAPGKPGKPLIPLNPGSPAGPGFPVNEEHQKISVYNNGWNGQFLQWTELTPASRKQSGYWSLQAFVLDAISTEKHSNVSYHFHSCALTNHVDHSIYDLLL